jgi:hypothetical protein
MQTTPMQGTATAYTFVGDDNHTGSNDSQDFSIGKASTTVVTVTGAHLLIPVQNSSYRKCNRCRRIKPYTDC